VAVCKSTKLQEIPKVQKTIDAQTGTGRIISLFLRAVSVRRQMDRSEIRNAPTQSYVGESHQTGRVQVEQASLPISGNSAMIPFPNKGT
jgi:hypothetical protein